jgi:hypothetical protein
VQAEQAHKILDTGAQAAQATEEFFTVMAERREDTPLTQEQIDIVDNYCNMRDQFDSTVRTRGVV